MATTTSASSGSTGTSKATSGGIVKGFLILAVVLIVGQWAWKRDNGGNAPAQPTAAQGYTPSSSSGPMASPEMLPEVPLFKKRSFMVTTEWGPKIYLRGNRLAVWNGPNVVGRSDVQEYVEKDPSKGGLSFAPATWVQLRAKSGADEVTMCSHPIGTSGKECN